MKTGIGDYLSWLFFPSRFFRGDNGKRTLPLAGFETLYFVDRSPRLAAVNRATGTVFLGGMGNAFLGPLLGPQSVFLLDHEPHRLSRKIMGAVLTRRAAECFIPVVDQIVKEQIEAAQRAGSINVGAWTRFLAMRVVCRVALGMEDPQSVRRLYRRFESTTGFLANIVSFCKRFWRDSGLLSFGGIAAFLVRRIDRELYPLIEARRRQLDSGGYTGAPLTALDALLQGQTEHGYDDAFVRDNLVALLAAGYDTTGSALTWMCHWLWHESDLFVRLIAAQKSGDQAMLDNFRNEVLRYCPPIDILPRRINPDCWPEALDTIPDLDQVNGGSAGPMVCPYVHRAHHNSRVFERPEEFCPERFAGERRYSTDEYLPFGTSVRMCLGRNFGNLVMDRLLHQLLARGMRFELSSARFAPVRRNVSLWPAISVKGRLVAEPPPAGPKVQT